MNPFEAWSADDVSTWGNAWLIISLVVGVVSTFAVIWSGNIKEAALKRELAASNERTAALGKETADAKLQTVQLRATFSWRVLSLQKAQALIARLAKTPGKVQIAYMENDPESKFFAIQLSKIFEAAKWQFGTGVRSYPSTLYYGTLIPDSDNPSVNDIREAFTENGLTFSTEKVPLPPAYQGRNPAPDYVLVMIGSKRPAF